MRDEGSKRMQEMKVGREDTSKEERKETRAAMRMQMTFPFFCFPPFPFPRSARSFPPTRHRVLFLHPLLVSPTKIFSLPLSLPLALRQTDRQTDDGRHVYSSSSAATWFHRAPLALSCDSTGRPVSASSRAVTRASCSAGWSTASIGCSSSINAWFSALPVRIFFIARIAYSRRSITQRTKKEASFVVSHRSVRGCNHGYPSGECRSPVPSLTWVGVVNVALAQHHNKPVA